MAQQNHGPEESWHLDKKVPIALIVAILGQAATIIWWARGVEENVAAQARRIEGLEKTALGVSAAISSIQVDVARIDERSKAQTGLLQDIRSALKP